MQPGRNPRDPVSFGSSALGASPSGDQERFEQLAVGQHGVGHQAAEPEHEADATEPELPRDRRPTDRFSASPESRAAYERKGQEHKNDRESGEQPIPPRRAVPAERESRTLSGREGEFEGLPRDTLRDLRLSSGYYSRTDAQVESIEVTIPRAPRVPKIEEPAAPLSSPHSERIPREGAKRRVLIGPTLRRQADTWLLSGSLELPTTASPRHARAKQRALLVALLMEPGFDNLPLGLQQRASWLLRGGWGAGPGERDVDDCLTCLGIEATPSTRRHLIEALEPCVPEVDLPPPSSRNSQAPSSFASPSMSPGSTIRVSSRPAARSSSPAQERPTSRPPRRP